MKIRNNLNNKIIQWSLAIFYSFFSTTAAASYIQESEQTALDHFIALRNKAIETASYHEYLAFFDPSFYPDMSWWPKWRKLRKKLKRHPFSIEAEVTSIEKQSELFTVYLNQFLLLNGQKKSIGAQKLFIRRTNGELKIIKEDSLENDGKTGTHFMDRLDLDLPGPKKLATPNRIKRIVKNWAKAWSSMNIDKYAAFYASSFVSEKGMNKKSWIQYKKSLNRKYDYITVTLDHLKIKKKKASYIASFKQHYRSNRFISICNKKLVLIAEAGTWKINREFSR